MRVSLQELEDMLGADSVASDSETCMVYSRDVAALPGLAYQIVRRSFDIIVQPTSTESLRKLVKLAVKRRVALVPRGNGTSGWGGALPSRGGVCVCTAQLSKIVGLNEAMTAVTVEAGVTWRNLLLFLEPFGLTLPVYPSSAAAATVGGFVSSGGIGIGSSTHGPIEDQVLGLEAVLADGSLVELGSLQTEKNIDSLAALPSAVRELCEEGAMDPYELFLGTYGTLGVITKVCLKVLPKLQMRPFACSFNTLESLAVAAQAIISTVKPYHLRFLADTYTDKLSSLFPVHGAAEKHVLAGALHGTTYDNDAGLESIAQTAAVNGGRVLDDRRSEYYWYERLFPLRIKRYGPSLIPAELMIPISEMAPLLEAVARAMDGSSYSVEGTLCNDLSTSFLVWVFGDERKSIAYTTAWHRPFYVSSLAAKYGGRPYAVGLWNAPIAHDFYGERRLRFLREAKSRLDPNGILNPMKVFGGRVKAAPQSLLLGFMVGLAGMTALLVLPFLFGLTEIQQWIIAPLDPIFRLPAYVTALVVAGFAGLAFIYAMSLKTALRLVMPLLRLLDKLNKL